MATKHFHYEKGEHVVDFSVDYRMPTQQEFLSIAGIISLLAGILFLHKAFRK
ncbi:hypothetical protein GCM10008932_08480 [Alkalibacterium iburiense]|uniref:Gram-positive cocci surface proteins LPxTG domain-containing protein n=1 Tax=Alkalibacterium iburiense TaxID=290589 RepID=A0ABN0X8S4_9LACT